MVPVVPILAALLLPAAAPAWADSRGAVAVIDADTFDVGGVRVRLHGIDAPEAGQACQDAEGEPWPCGAEATAQARALWEGREAICDEVDLDRYGREVSRCAVAGRDVGGTLVAMGLAVAYTDYSTDYVPVERAARAAGAGLWRGSFEYPWDWRRASHDAAAGTAASASSGDCRVKGKVSDRGRIYRLPGTAGYDATRIDPRHGERWFCSAAEAEAAGWRAPRS